MSYLPRKPQKRASVEELWASAVDAKSEKYDWREHQIGEDWEIAVPMPDFDSGEKEEDMEDEDDFYEQNSPMMNFRYPLPGFKPDRFSDKNLRRALDNAGNITLVQDLKSDEYYLALTGGGMDLTWDIARAYVNLGYLPPADFCRLPGFVDYGHEEDDKTIIHACKRTASFLENWAKGLAHDLDNTEKFFDDEVAKRKSRDR